MFGWEGAGSGGIIQRQEVQQREFGGEVKSLIWKERAYYLFRWGWMWNTFAYVD